MRPREVQGSQYCASPLSEGQIQSERRGSFLASGLKGSGRLRACLCGVVIRISDFCQNARSYLRRHERRFQTLLSLVSV